jgi:hypothetical protein
VPVTAIWSTRFERFRAVRKELSWLWKNTAIAIRPRITGSGPNSP